MGGNDQQPTLLIFFFRVAIVSFLVLQEILQSVVSYVSFLIWGEKCREFFSLYKKHDFHIYVVKVT